MPTLSLKYGYLEDDNTFNDLAGIGWDLSADYDNEMISFSAEFGRKFMSESGWFIEPQLQAQYTYITDVSYTAESGTAVDIDGIDSLIGSVGFRSGRSLSDPPLTFLYALRLDA